MIFACPRNLRHALLVEGPFKDYGLSLLRMNSERVLESVGEKWAVPARNDLLPSFSTLQIILNSFPLVFLKNISRLSYLPKGNETRRSRKERLFKVIPAIS